MIQQMKNILITGANSGLGKESARQIALLKSTECVYLGCRNIKKAEAAKADLEQLTGRNVFEILQIDLMDTDSVRLAVASLPGQIDGLIMNAGGIGGPTPSAMTEAGVTHIFAMNVHGHALLADELIAAGKLKSVAIIAGSGASRGEPKVRLKAPTFETSSVDELASVADGSWLKGKHTAMAAYAASKYIAALWIGSMARRHPSIRFVTMGPGGTNGTAGADSMQGFQRIFVKYIGKPLMVTFGMMHSVEKGSARFINALRDETYKSGVFYASSTESLLGDVVDQSTILPDFANRDFQDNAYEAIHRFL
jgi:NAD(P)-dependent dehydrogenase (short-subunit alcohol dehydrogenase family)